MTGIVTVDGIALFESREAPADGDTFTLTGRESVIDYRGGVEPALTAEQVLAAHHNVLGLRDRATSVVFSDKTHLTGFYRVTDVSSALTKYGNGAVHTATWSMTLELIGSERDVEIESRVPTMPRLDELTGTQTPSYWHAPAVGYSSYWTGSTVPGGSVSRASSDGAVTVHTGIPTTAAPRWTVGADEYLLGSARILLDGIRRAGTFTPPHTAWRMHNGIVQVAGEPGGAFTVAVWDDSDWRSVKGFSVTVSGTPLTTTPELEVVRNDPGECAVRLTYPTSPGRVTVDLAVRRGSRFVTGIVKRHSAAALGVVRTAAEAASVVTGGLRATSADAAGNRFVMGSTRTVTTATGTAAISKASVTAFDFFLGHEYGASPASGDAFADLLLQYIGSSGSERTRIVRR